MYIYIYIYICIYDAQYTVIHTITSVDIIWQDISHVSFCSAASSCIFYFTLNVPSYPAPLKIWDVIMVIFIKESP